MKSVGPLWGKIVLALVLFLVLASQALAAPPDPPDYHIFVAPRPQVTWIDGDFYYIWEGQPPYVLYMTAACDEWVNAWPCALSLNRIPACEVMEYQVIDGSVSVGTDGPGGCDVLGIPSPPYAGAPPITATVAMTITQAFSGYGDSPSVGIVTAHKYEHDFGWAFNISNNLGAQTVYLPLVVK